MTEVGTIEIADGIGVLIIDSPPVNALSAAVRKALDDGFRQLANDAGVKAIVLLCAGRTFIAGADITELGKPPVPPSLLDVFKIIESGTKPVIAAIHGTALGGGYEFALVCHYRIAVPSAKVGLPEVALGLLPGGGGTQRLPRLVGVEAALELICGGQPVEAERALQLGMVNALAREGHLREDAISFARRLVDEGAPLQRVRDRQEKVEPARGHPEIYAEFLAKNATAFRGFKAPFNIVKAIEAAAELPFDAGIARERELFGELLASPESAAQRYHFFAQRLVNKPPALTPDNAVLIAGRIKSAVPDPSPEAISGALQSEAANVGAALLAEGIAARAADIDVACIRHMGWPAYTGGPMFAADAAGLDRVVADLRAKGIQPAPLLAEKAASGRAFAS